ncbi:MAG: 4Fe-4S dicluster domain-containing protein [Myxococcales bacterium]|nr:4Fe-4S dicluster domain-containing protein [Myxococcota bacterium]MDW8283472.1 4Fe-4S dicluster domain-containing protein [Myxococcales bacterium]
MSLSSRPGEGSQVPEATEAEVRTTASLPVLATLDSDDEEAEEGKPKLLQEVLAARPRRPLRPRWAKEKLRQQKQATSRPGRLPDRPPVGDLFSDTPTQVAPAPTGMSELPRLDASVASQIAGERELTVTTQRSEHPEPTITVAEDFLEDMGIIPPDKMPSAQTRPPIAYEDLPIGPQDATRIIAINAVEHVVPHSGPIPTGRGPSSRPGTGAAPVVSRPGTMPLPGFVDLSEARSSQEQTRIVASLDLKELQEPRSRRTRAQAAVRPEATSPASPTGPTADATAEVKAPGAKPKKNLIALIKARTKAKQAPVDPSRLMTQAEMAERLAKEKGEDRSLLSSFFKQSGLAGDGVAAEEVKDPTEGTMIGRFLGMVGLGPGGQSQAGAAQKKKEKDPTQETWELVQEIPFLDGINPQFLRDAVSAGDIRIVSLGRDQLLETQRNVLLVVEGQLAIARFDPSVLERERRAQRAFKPGDKKAEKREQNRRQEVGPLVRLCEANLALFLEGDVVGLDASTERDPRLAVYSVTPVKLLSISKARLESWRRTYQFFAERVHNAAEAARSRIEVASGARGQVADFYIRHGMSVAMTLRVRELDKCIECYECEKACEERYGVKRLSLKGKMLGALDFVDCCRTCIDQRCVDVCGYDAIKYHPDRQEVLINEEACTGCSMCSIACPYDAIEMHELDEQPLLKLRLEREKKLDFGEGKARKAQIRRIASKCDHCVNYEDQACISACPTSALLEVAPEMVFTERTEEMAEAARGGFLVPAPADPVQVFNPERFFKGFEGKKHQGRQVEQKMRIGWLWLVSLIGLFGCVLEIALRKLAPTASGLFYYQTQIQALDTEVALLNIDYRPGSEFAVWLGWIGTVIMFSSTFYSAHKWVPGLRKLGSYQSWFDYHVWAGTVGPMFILLHTAAKLDNWVSLAVWAMIATVLSGLVGRYLSTNLPDMASQAALRVLDLEQQLAELRNRHAGVAAAERYHDSLRRRFLRVTAPELSGFRAGLMAFRLLVADDLARPLRTLRLRRRLVGIKDRRARAQVARLTAKLVLVDRQRLLLPRIEPLFQEWKTIHIPFAIVLSILASIHIFVELVR